MHVGGGVAERRRLPATFLSQRVAPVGDRGAIEGRQRASFGERHCREAAETELAALATDGDALDPRLGPGALYEQVQTSAVAVRSGFLGSVSV